MTQKEIDLELERQFGLFLSEKLYPGRIKIKERITDIKRQLEGIDIILEDGTKVDEKSQLSYINQDGLPTFAFELDFINQNNQHSIGWLFNNELLTDAYFLCRYIYTYENETKDMIEKKIRNKENIHFKSALVQRLNKNNLYQELSINGLNKNRLLNYATLVRNHVDKNIQGDDIDVNGLRIYHIENFQNGQRIYIEMPEIKKNLAYLTYTTYLNERPINLILRDGFLQHAKLSYVASGC